MMTTVRRIGLRSILRWVVALSAMYASVQAAGVGWLRIGFNQELAHHFAAAHEVREHSHDHRHGPSGEEREHEHSHGHYSSVTQMAVTPAEGSSSLRVPVPLSLLSLSLQIAFSKSPAAIFRPPISS